MKRFVMAAAVRENNLYFSDRFSNGLYRLNLDNGDCTFIDYFYEEEGKGQLYIHAYMYGQKIFFIPFLADNIACFDIVSEKISYIRLPREGRVIHGVNGIFAEKFSCQRCRNILWMMPVGYNLFLKLDLTDGCLRKVELPKRIVFQEGIFNWRTNSLYEGEMIFQPWARTLQVRYDTVSGIIRLTEFEEGIRTYRTYLKKENHELYVPWELKYGLLVKNTANKKKRFFFKENVWGDTCVITFLVGNTLYLIPQSGQTAILVHITDFSIEYVDFNKQFNRNETEWGWNEMTESESKYYVFSYTIPDILVVDRCNGEFKLIGIREESRWSINRRVHRCIENLDKKTFQIDRKRILKEASDGLEQIFAQTARNLENKEKDRYFCGKMIYENLRGV